MGFMAIAASDACGEHLALLERRIVVGFLGISHLPVGMIRGARDWFDDVRLRKPLAGNPVLTESSSACVAQAACFDFLPKRARRDAAACRTGSSIDRPGDIAAFVEAHDQALARILVFAKWPPAFLVARPRGMV